MRSIFSRITLAAIFGFALTFTFSCSAINDAIGDSSSSSVGEQKCGGVSYDPSTYRCEAGELIGKCKGVDYYPAYQQCVSGVVVDGGSSSPSVGSSSSVKSSSSSSSSSNVTPTYSLDGIWEEKGNVGHRVTISGSTGVVSAFGDVGALVQSAIDKGYVTLNSLEWRNLKSTGNLTWSGEQKGLTANKSNLNVATGVAWTNATFTLSVDGQTLTIKGTFSGSGDFTSTFTRSNHSLDGVWENNYNKGRVTVSGSTGVVSAFADVNSAAVQSAIDKGYVTLNSVTWRNLKSTGNLIWSGELKGLTINKSNPNVATGVTWINATFTLSADGQTLTIKGTDSSGDFTDTFTRKQ